MRSIRRREIARLNLTVRARVELSGKFLKSALNSKSSLKMKFRVKFYLSAQVHKAEFCIKFYAEFLAKF